ncbi:MAG: glycosyltransferase [Bacteroidales bacterium]
MVIRDHPLFLIFFVIFGLSAIVQIFYYLYFYLSAGRFRHQETGNDFKGPVSVIICARNEEENLRKFLPAVLEQDYPEFEVIVVNDCSEDNSFEVLGGFLKKYPNLKVSNIVKDPKFTHNKKFAQFIGIKASANELLLFTDADCYPESGQWIRNMVSHFDDNTSFVLGYGGYIGLKGFLNKYIRSDSMTIAMQYMGLALRGIPYMGIGRNLAYRRSLFFGTKGFAGHNQLASGDDDLFVNAHASAANTAVEFRKESHTRSLPAATAEEWLKQKKRHFTTARYYKQADKLILAAEPFSRVLFYGLFAVLVSALFLWPVVVGIFAVRLIIQVIVVNMSQKRFNEPGILLYVLLFDIVSPVINSGIYLSNYRPGSGRKRWN